MPSWLPSKEYPSIAPNGYWAPITSTINWCEEDYYATLYLAEIINSLTNFLFFYLAYRGIGSCIKHGHDTIFLVSFVGYLLVGIGSFTFHATLKYPMQLVDELNMIYTTCLMCYASFSYSRSRQFRLFLGMGLASLALFITLYYHYLQDPAFHQNTFTILTLIVMARGIYVMETALRPSWKMRAAKRRGGGGGKETMTIHEFDDRRDAKILATMWLMIGCGTFMFIGGFFLWSFDNHYCSSFRQWRRAVGLPWGVFLEGHGWWHLMTGTGAYFYLMWGIWLRHCLNRRQDEYRLDWPRLFSFPDLVRAEEKKKTR